MSYLFLDIETIPAQSDAIRAHIASTIKPPTTMKKAETIEAWEKEAKAAAVEEAIAKTALDGTYGQICCIGMAFDREAVTTVSWPSIECGNERELLQWFAQFIATSKGNVPVIVGHNVVSFDIRFIWQRAMVNGVRLPSWFPRDPKPWGNEAFDTMTAWAGQRGTISLDRLCTALGLPGKDDIDGSMVGKLWAEGKHKEIAAYCKADVERVRSVFRKMQVAYGNTQLDEVA